MKREHTPGCYCCSAGPPEEVCPTACCDENENWPTFAPGASWQLRSRHINAECCCLTEVFDYIEGPVKECCLPCGSYSYEMKNESNQYAFRKPPALLNFETQCGTPSCLTSCCQVGDPELIATWVTTMNDEFTYFFQARFLFNSLEIKYGKEFIQCPGEEEPVCRYFLKYTIFATYGARIEQTQLLTVKRELSYLHPCWNYNPDFKSSCPQWASSVECEFDKVIIDRCNDPDQQCGWPPAECCEGFLPCVIGNGQFCVERIKYFDEPPSGMITFGEDDINTPPGGNPEEYCTDPYCDTVCNNGYTTEVEIRSGIPLPPFWYTNPPTVNSVSTTYLVEWDFCNALGMHLYPTAGAFQNCCDNPPVVIFTPCDPVSCQNPQVEVTVVCEGLDFNEDTWVYDPEDCRLSSSVSYTGSFGGECGYARGNPVGLPIVGEVFANDGNCYFPLLGLWDRQHPACGAWIGNCISYIPAGEDSCPAGDCYATFTCGGCFCYCNPTFVFAFYQSNAVSFTTSGSWMEQSCSYTGFNLMITVNV